MEQSLAILMADLSGYTALTEVHGAVSAADLIDRYLEIVEDCLVGDCIVKERRGDEVMIVSKSADCLLTTAAMIMKHTSAQHNFLQVHGGLHYGNVLTRKDSFFGSAINLTSRIAAKASPGTFWCSLDFIDALIDPSAFTFDNRGRHSFKNIHEEKELSELLNVHTDGFSVDPICRMLIRDKDKAFKHPQEMHLYFCSQSCLDIFDNANNKSATHK